MATKSFKIYTAGKMAGLSSEKQHEWRRKVENSIRNVTELLNMPQSNISFIHPPLFYEYGENYHQSEREVKNWDLNQVRQSDIVIVNLDNVDSSIGTHYELATVDAVNAFGGKHIFVIGVGGECKELHPWIADTLHRREPNYDDAARYIVNYLLV